MLKIPSLIPALAILLAWSSCSGFEQVIEIDLPEHEPMIVVNSTFTPDSNWVVSLTKSKGIQDPSPYQNITGALVEILQNGSPIDTLEPYGENYSSAQTRPLAGETYTLRARVANLGTATATNRAPIPAVIRSATLIDSVATGPFGERLGQANVEIEDPAGEDNFYSLGIYIRQAYVFLTDTIYYYSPIYVEIDDPSVETTITNSEILFRDTGFNGRSKQFSIDVYYDLHSDLEDYYLILGTVSEDYFLYGLSYSLQQNVGGNPFAEPVFTHSNVEGGVGIFAGFSTTLWRF